MHEYYRYVQYVGLHVDVVVINEKNEYYKSSFLTKVNHDFCERKAKTLTGI